MQSNEYLLWKKNHCWVFFVLKVSDLLPHNYDTEVGFISPFRIWYIKIHNIIKIIYKDLNNIVFSV